MKIISEFNNGLLKRKEFEVVNNYDSNPGIEKVKKDVLEFFKIKEENLSINKIKSNFGRSEFVIDFFVYESPEIKIELARKKKEKKAK